MRPIMADAVTRSIALAQEYAIATAANNMNSTVEIKRFAKAIFSDAAREIRPPIGTHVYSGVAGLTIASGSVQIDLGDETNYFSSLTCYLPQASVHVIVDDVIKVITNPDDDLVGHYFRATDIEVGGRIVGSIAVHAMGIVPSRQWAWS